MDALKPWEENNSLDEVALVAELVAYHRRKVDAARGALRWFVTRASHEMSEAQAAKVAWGFVDIAKAHLDYFGQEHA